MLLSVFLNLINKLFFLSFKILILETKHKTIYNNLFFTVRNIVCVFIYLKIYTSTQIPLKIDYFISGVGDFCYHIYLFFSLSRIRLHTLVNPIFKHQHFFYSAMIRPLMH